MTLPEIILLRASLYVSWTFNRVIFAPRTRKYPSLEADEDESSYGIDEPVTALQFESGPERLGNRLKATLLASNPEVFREDEQFRTSFGSIPDMQTLMQEVAEAPRRPPLYLSGFGGRKHMVKDPVLLVSAATDYTGFEANYRHWFVNATEDRILVLGVPSKSTGLRKFLKSSIRLGCSDRELGEFILNLQASG